MKSLKRLLSALPYELRFAGEDVSISGIYDDSRRVRPGGLFVAYKGVETDGHRFIGNAIDNGAVAIVGEAEISPDGVPYIRVPDGREALALLAAAWFDFPASKLDLIGVTGTDGKTTTSTLIFNILDAWGKKVGLISTVEAILGDGAQPTGLHTTTPPALEIQEYLHRMVENGVEAAVIEATSHGLAQRRLDGCEFDVAVVTNVTHEHLDFHKTDEQYVAAKRRLFDELLVEGGTAVLNVDDRSYRLFQPLPRARIVTYGLDAPADFTAEEVSWGPQGLSMKVISPDGEFPVASTLVGRFNVYNILAAVAAAAGMGAPREAIAEGVRKTRGVPGRMEVIDRGQPFTAIVDFAHTPNALENALAAIRSMTKGRVIAVFGSAGERDREKRRLMGIAAGRLADFVVITAEDPRREPLDAIMEEIAAGCRESGMKQGWDFVLVPDRWEAIKTACEMAREGDAVIVCGKGHEQSMCFGTTEYPWDDRIALAEVMEGRKESRFRLPTSSARKRD